ncbi:site-specific integrase [Haloarchaeobius sp. FL176]|uniref:tyrosine-type recombinase/integrase n=1 Tax=Haloarchaeobius sp. FL176 TaxID=2967129 RepID=UPI00214936BE|nr:site-specific integrase [Haloarchaeobius sp. FL176]
MTEDLDPLPPELGVDLYIDSRKDDTAQWTRTSQTARLRPFIEWCEENDVGTLADLDGRDLYEYRVWRREGNYSGSKVDQLAGTTLKSSMTTLRRFLKFAATIEAVPEELYDKVPVPSIEKGGDVSDSSIDPERVPPILEYLETYEYASRTHVILLLLWHCGARTGGIRALDLRDIDLDGDQPGVEFVHRPETDTPLKNQTGGERYNRITPRVARIVQAYLDGPRKDKEDDYGRNPLITTRKGRVSTSCIRNTLYKVTRPCWLDNGCPHNREIDECEAVDHTYASKCPSTRSPHDVRKARVTKYRNDGVPREVVSDRLDASEFILDKHYDRASEREKANRRWKHLR